MSQKIFAIINQKGGVGKTTTAVSLAAAYARMKRSVLLIDFDPQTNASTATLDQWSHSVGSVLEGDTPINDAIYQSPEGFDVLPADYHLTSTELKLLKTQDKESKLKQALATLNRSYDFILIDCSPSLNILTINALVSAQNILIPIQCEYYALEGLAKLLQTIDSVSKQLQVSHKLYLLRTMYDGRNRLAVDVSNELSKHFTGQLLQTVIPRNIRLAEAPSFGESIFTYDKSSQGAIAYLALAGELNRLTKQLEQQDA